ncbi:hypothetical protein [Iningainema tapete]|nr:hypothetical protein [Iningainema tapete]
MLRSCIPWFIPIAVTLVSFASGVKKVAAQTVFPFEAFYDTDVILRPIENTDVSIATVSGFNPDAPYGLTNFTSASNYSRFDPAINGFRFFADPARVGLSGFPTGVDTFFGSGDDRIFGSSNAIAIIDPITNTLNGTGVINITGGAGRFSGATGTLNFNESESLDQDPSGPLRGRAFISGSFVVPQQVPESGNTATLVGIGAITTGFLLRRRLKSAI